MDRLVGKYGTYGGCISRINAKTNKVDSWPSSVERQAVNSIVAGVKYIYYTAGKNGNSLDSLDCVPSIVTVNYDGEFVKNRLSFCETEIYLL